MNHFAHLEKEVEKTGQDLYRIRLRYYQSDETEIVIRILSFGPVIKVLEPESFVEQIRSRLRRQMECGIR
jgi:predicted DNA-binding transcriptional regulator YafY